MHIYNVIKRPIITEQSTKMVEELRQFTFEVDLKANKVEIKDAVQQIYNVTVLKVTTNILPMKRGMRGRKEIQRKPAFKKAIVTLAEGNTIDLFNV